ncbi:MAG: hypothetical protein KTR30_12535, partial [Saprospiraceae bacterium]|nr:hypothetical protein [Saprospiraceae bacterium]
MPISKSELLNRLILSLTKAEKRNFRLYARKIQQEGELKFVALFDFLEKNGDIDENTLLKKLEIQNKSQFSSLKRHLYQHLLTSLRLLYNQRSLDIRIRELADFATILYQKNLYLEALQLLNKSKQLARKSHKDHLHLELVEFEKKIESRHITRASTERILDLIEEAQARKKVITSVTELSNLKLRLQRFFINNGPAQNDTDKEKIHLFFQSLLPPLDEQNLTFFEKVYLNQSSFWLHYCKLDFEACLRHANNWVQLFQDEPDMINKDLEIYLKGLHYRGLISFCLKDGDTFLDTQTNLQACLAARDIDWTEITSIQHRLFLINGQINKLLLFPLIEDVEQQVRSALEQLTTIQDRIDPHKVMIIQYKIAQLYLRDGQIDRGIDYLNQILNHPGKHLRVDLQIYTRLSLLMAHHDQHNDIVTDYLLNTTQRFFQKNGKMSSTPLLILQLFKKITKLDPRRAKEEMQSCLEELNQLASAPYERRAFVFLDIRPWLIGHLEQQPMKEVIV